jgi:hypothetical protein
MPEGVTSRATTGSPPHRMGRLRSEDSATGKTEGGRSELRRTHALRMKQPHARALAHGQRDATQAVGNLCRLEENALSIH